MAKNLIKMPLSKFCRVTCKKCKKDQIIFNKPSTVVKCLNCGEELAYPTGGQTEIRGKVLETFG